MHRADWMRKRANPLYEEWVDATLVMASEPPMVQRITQSFDAYLRRNNGQVIGPHLGAGEYIIETAHRYIGHESERTATSLIDRKDEISHFTSVNAGFFKSRSRQLERRVTTHALDGMAFGLVGSFLLARDVAIQELYPWQEHDPQEGNEFWDTNKQRIETIATILEKKSFHSSLEDMSTTGFGVLTNAYTMVGGNRGAASRAAQVDQLSRFQNKEMYAVIEGTMQHGYAVRPEVRNFLHAQLRQQNRVGIKDGGDAGTIPRLYDLETPQRVTRGCPVAQASHERHEVGRSESAIEQTARYGAWLLREVIHNQPGT